MFNFQLPSYLCILFSVFLGYVDYCASQHHLIVFLFFLFLCFMNLYTEFVLYLCFWAEIIFVPCFFYILYNTDIWQGLLNLRLIQRRNNSNFCIDFNFWCMYVSTTFQQCIILGWISWCCDSSFVALRLFSFSCSVISEYS